MGQTSRETWAKRVARWKASGLRAKEFGAKFGIKPKSLEWWKWRLGADAKRQRRPADRGGRRSGSRGGTRIRAGGGTARRRRAGNLCKEPVALASRGLDEVAKPTSVGECLARHHDDACQRCVADRRPLPRALDQLAFEMSRSGFLTRKPNAVPVCTPMP